MPSDEYPQTPQRPRCVALGLVVCALTASLFAVCAYRPLPNPSLVASTPAPLPLLSPQMHAVLFVQCTRLENVFWMLEAAAGFVASAAVTIAAPPSSAPIWSRLVFM